MRNRLLVYVSVWLLLPTLGSPVFVGPAAAADERDPVKEMLDAAKATYEAKAKEHRDVVMKRLEAKENQAAATANKKLLEKVAADRDQFENSGVLPTVVDTSDIKSSSDKDRKVLVNAYKTAEAQYLMKKLKAEAKIVAEELEEFEAAIGGRPLWCRPVSRRLAEKFVGVRGNGNKVEFKLDGLQHAFTTDPDFRLLKPKIGVVNQAVVEARKLASDLKNPQIKAPALNAQLTTAQRAVDKAIEAVNNLKSRDILRDLRERLEKPSQKNP
jgi:hypothetical protein